MVAFLFPILDNNVMKNKFLLPLSVFALSLTSCATGVHHDISEYILETAYTADYRILTLSDIHLGDKDDQDIHYRFMDLTIQDANADMIVVTGDLFTYASKGTAKRLFEFLDSYNIPWTVIFGNHDEQCFFSIDWMTDYLNNQTKNCLFKDIQDDDVYGNCNFAINLMNGNQIFEQLIFMDSNRYYYADYFGYDYIKPDQIEWYKNLVDYTKTQNGGTLVDSFLYYHIPLPEIMDVYEKAKAGTDGATYEFGDKDEKPCPPDYNSGFFDVVVEKGSTKAMFFGHDHINDFIVKYQGVDFIYAIKATDRIYYNDNMMGGRVTILHNDHTYSHEVILHTYEEVQL